ncbi:hypothetical protein [Herbidospora daliensis]|uniref:hypothetical protein n=1 Tax=Herbidospora daliensis TaxID=295585 RepID=UPI000AFA3F73|nr:hypothetical protein [Herbidospora daliensis]
MSLLAVHDIRAGAQLGGRYQAAITAGTGVGPVLGGLVSAWRCLPGRRRDLV